MCINCYYSSIYNNHFFWSRQIKHTAWENPLHKSYFVNCNYVYTILLYYTEFTFVNLMVTCFSIGRSWHGLQKEVIIIVNCCYCI